MNQDYVDTVRLLLAIAPSVFKPSHFALKGGTALNLFVQMLEKFGWNSTFVDCFVAYLAGHNRPVHEVLFPRKQPLEPAFTSEFAGMTREVVALAALEQTQYRLMTHLPGALTVSHRDFLLSLVSAEPAWELMPFKHMPQLPALQWKLLNLRKLKSRNAGRFAAQHDELAASFKNLPYPRESPP